MEGEVCALRREWAVEDAGAGNVGLHRAAAELSQLIEAANRVGESAERRPELVVLRRLSVA
jgi:hypothetical protein